ncbi:MAG TPA: DNA-directed RNA polymerase subunit omega [Desulfomonilaceae bacterium]|nr:DNA-directed RNA polymerase subunit omega [Desulfomonilaceae bacterium]
MARVTVEDCLSQVENRFALVILASKRTKELKRGAPLTIPLRDNREVVMALREIAAGDVKGRGPTPEELNEVIVDVKSS